MKKPVPVIKAVKIERIEHPDGRVDTIVHVPRMALKKAIGAERAKQLIDATDGKRISSPQN